MVASTAWLYMSYLYGGLQACFALPRTVLAVNRCGYEYCSTRLRIFLGRGGAKRLQ